MKKIFFGTFTFFILIQTSYGAWNLDEINQKGINKIDLVKDHIFFNIQKRDIITKDGGSQLIGNTSGVMDNNSNISGDNIDRNNNEKVIGEVTDGTDTYEPPIIFPTLTFNIIEDKIQKAIFGIIRDVKREIVTAFKSTLTKYKPKEIYSLYALNTPGAGGGSISGGGSNTILTDVISDYNKNIGNSASQRVSSNNSSGLSRSNQQVDNLETKKNITCAYGYILRNGVCVKKSTAPSTSTRTRPKVTNDSIYVPDSIPALPKYESNNNMSRIDDYNNRDTCYSTSLNSQQYEACKLLESLNKF